MYCCYHCPAVGVRCRMRCAGCLEIWRWQILLALCMVYEMDRRISHVYSESIPSHPGWAGVYTAPIPSHPRWSSVYPIPIPSLFRAILDRPAYILCVLCLFRIYHSIIPSHPGFLYGQVYILYLSILDGPAYLLYLFRYCEPV